MTGRGLAGRRIAQCIVIATIALDVLLALLVLAEPNTMGGHVGPPPASWPGLGWLIGAIGVVLHLVGLAWMVRILRADPEGGGSSWRAFRQR